MKFNTNQLYLLLALTLLEVCSFSSCSPGEKYPIEPMISNLSYTFNEDEYLVLKFNFTDGDADIGLTPADSLAPFDRNFYADYKEKQNGKFVHVAIPPAMIDTQYYNYRIPLLNEDGTRKSIKGEIEVEISLRGRDSDTVKFEFYLVDRELHKSNTLFTGPIIIPN